MSDAVCHIYRQMWVCFCFWTFLLRFASRCSLDTHFSHCFYLSLFSYSCWMNCCEPSSWLRQKSHFLCSTHITDLLKQSGSTDSTLGLWQRTSGCFDHFWRTYQKRNFPSLGSILKLDMVQFLKFNCMQSVYSLKDIQ